MIRTTLTGLFSGITLLGALNVAVAETSTQKGLRIAKEAEAASRGYGDFTATMKMTLTNRSGLTSTRVIRTKNLEGINGQGDKTLSLIDQPENVKGTKVLTFSHKAAPDDQWLYLPALKRVKRINTRNMSRPFMGSEFAFEDLGSQGIQKYTYNYLREEPCTSGSPLKCHVVERVPTYKYSGYVRQVVWLDTAGFRVVRVTYYDRKNTLHKTLSAHGYQKYLGKYWRPAKMVMQNHQSGKSTTLELSSYKFKTGLKPSDFDSKSLAKQL